MWNLIKALGQWLDDWQKAREDNPGQMLLLVGLLLVVIQISPYWYATRDGAEYISVARSIATTGEFHNYGSPRTKVPPVYPLAISPAWWTGERPWLAISVIQAAWGLALLVGCWWWFRKVLPDHAVLLAGVALVNASLWFYYARTLKEILFLALLLGTIWAIHQFLKRIEPGPERPVSARKVLGWGVLSSVMFTLLCLTRYSAIVLAGGLALLLAQQCWRERSGWWRPILIPAAISIVPFVAVFSYLSWDHQMAEVHGHGTYAQAWQQAGASFVTRLNESLIRRTEEFGRVLLPGMFKSYANEATWIDWNMLIFVPTIIVVLYGWWRLFRTGSDLFICLFPFYLLLYLAWPYQQGSRFAIAMLPLAFACYWTGCRQLLRFGPLFLSLLFLLHLGVATSYWLFVDRPRAAADHGMWVQVDELADHLPVEVLDTPDQIGVHRIPASLHSMLQVELDYRLYSFKDHPTFYPEATWMIQPASFPQPQEFGVVYASDEFELLKREQPGGELPKVK